MRISSVYLLALCVLSLASPSLVLAQIETETEKYDTPLMAAIRARHATEAKKLIDSGVDLNTKDCSSTPLIDSIASNQLELAEKLILGGASTKVGDNLGTLPLMIASWYCRQDIVSLLLDRGADVNALDIEGNSALIHSAQNCEDGAVPALLLRYGAKINLAAQDGDTALHVASFYGNEQLVHMLLAAGADPTLKTNGGETPLIIARDSDVGRKPSHDRIYQFLLEVSRLDQKLKPH